MNECEFFMQYYYGVSYFENISFKSVEIKIKNLASQRKEFRVPFAPGRRGFI